MANIILKDEKRQEEAEYIAKKYGVDKRDPAMMEAAEISAARTFEAVKAANERRRYY